MQLGGPHHLTLPRHRDLFLACSCPSAVFSCLVLAVSGLIAQWRWLRMLVYPAIALCGEPGSVSRHPKRQKQRSNLAMVAAISPCSAWKRGSPLDSTTESWEHLSEMQLFKPPFLLSDVAFVTQPELESLTILLHRRHNLASPSL